MNQKMDDKKVNEKSFEQEKQQKRKNPSVADDSHPTMSYREVRAKSESEQKKKKQKQSGRGNQRQKDSVQNPNDTNRLQQGQKKHDHAQRSEKPDSGKPKGQQSKVKPQQIVKNNQTHHENTQREKVPPKQHKVSPQSTRPSSSAERKSKQEHSQLPKVNASAQKGNSIHKKENIVQQKPLMPISEIEVKENEEKVSKSLKPAKPFSAKKKRRQLLAIYSSMVLIILMIATILCLTVFFKIDSISVEGETRYVTEDIVDASGIATGTNLLLCDADSGKDVIKKKFPYIENVSIRKNPFNSVTIFVEEAKPATAIETNGKFYILSSSGKIVEILNENKYNVPLIKGVELKKTELSATIEYKLDGMNNIINQIYETLESNEISNVSTIDVTNPSNIKLSYDSRLTIIIGMPENIDYKIKTAKVIIDEKLEKDSKGTVDVSMCTEGGKYSYYDPSGAPSN